MVTDIQYLTYAWIAEFATFEAVLVTTHPYRDDRRTQLEGNGFATVGEALACCKGFRACHYGLTSKWLKIVEPETL